MSTEVHQPTRDNTHTSSTPVLWHQEERNNSVIRTYIMFED